MSRCSSATAIVMAIGTAAGLVLPVILAAVVLTACLIPARRAARMDPAKP